MKSCSECAKWIKDHVGPMGTCTAHRRHGCGGVLRPIATHASDFCETRFASKSHHESATIESALGKLEALCAR